MISKAAIGVRYSDIGQSETIEAKILAHVYYATHTIAKNVKS
jgi:hypothetical protein